MICIDHNLTIPLLLNILSVRLDLAIFVTKKNSNTVLKLDWSLFSFMQKKTQISLSLMACGGIPTMPALSLLSCYSVILRMLPHFPKHVLQVQPLHPQSSKPEGKGQRRGWFFDETS